MTREFEEIRKEAGDTETTPDPVLEAYVETPDMGLAEARRQTATLAERRAVESLAKRVMALEGDLRRFRVDLRAAPNLPELRKALGTLAVTATDLEVRVAEAMRTAGVTPS
jgi:hypothetical protein